MLRSGIAHCRSLVPFNCEPTSSCPPCSSQRLHWFTFVRQQYPKVSLSLYPCWHLSPLVFLMVTILTGVKWGLLVAVIYISLMINDVKYLLGTFWPLVNIFNYECSWWAISEGLQDLLDCQRLIACCYQGVFLGKALLDVHAPTRNHWMLHFPLSRQSCSSTPGRWLEGLFAWFPGEWCDTCPCPRQGIQNFITCRKLAHQGRLLPWSCRFGIQFLDCLLGFSFLLWVWWNQVDELRPWLCHQLGVTLKGCLVPFHLTVDDAVTV